MFRTSSPEECPDRIVVKFHSEGAGVPDIVREVCEERDWVQYDSSEHGPSDWNLWWKPGRFKPSDFEQLESWQRLNHHPLGGSATITTKDGLLREMRILQGTHGRSIIDFVPETFVMPREEREFKRRFADNKDKRLKNYWIFKPADMSRGRGIFVFNDLSDLRYSDKSVVQQYIADPLLIGGYKFDLRLYAVVVCFKPLVVYICREGLARFSTEKYDLNNLCDVYSHLTNTSINVGGPSYEAKKVNVGAGCKWSLSSLRHFLYSQSIDDNLVFAQIHAIIVLTVMSQAKSIARPAANCYELYGFDILLDSQLKAWLLEVNFSPAMAVDCPADAGVKRELLWSIFDMLCFTDVDRQQSRGHKEKQKSKRPSLDSGLGSARSLRRQKSNSSVSNLSRNATVTDSSLKVIDERYAAKSELQRQSAVSRTSSAISRLSSGSASRLPPLPRESLPSVASDSEIFRKQHRCFRENRASLLRSRQNQSRESLADQRAARKPPTNRSPSKRQPIGRNHMRMLPGRDPHSIDWDDDEEYDGDKEQQAIDTGELQRQLQEQQQLQDSSPYGSCPITQRWRRPKQQFGSLHLAFPFNRATESACRDIRQHERTAVRELQRLRKGEASNIDVIWPPVR